MSLQKGFSVAIYREGKYLDSMSYTSQDSMCKELRSLGAVFRNGTFKDLGEESITVYGSNGFYYEVEELPHVDKEMIYINNQGFKYIPLTDFCDSNNMTPSQVRYLISKGELDSMRIGSKNLIYVRVK